MGLMDEISAEQNLLDLTPHGVSSSVIARLRVNVWAGEWVNFQTVWRQFRWTGNCSSGKWANEQTDQRVK